MLIFYNSDSEHCLAEEAEPFILDYKDKKYVKPSQSPEVMKVIIDKINSLCDELDLSRAQLVIDIVPIKKINNKTAWDFMYERIIKNNDISVLFIEAQHENPPEGHPIIQAVHDLFYKATVISNAKIIQEPKYSIAFPNPCSLSITNISADKEISTGGITETESDQDDADLEIIGDENDDENVPFGATVDLNCAARNKIVGAFEMIGLVASLLLKAHVFGKWAIVILFIFFSQYCVSLRSSVYNKIFIR